MNGNAVRFFMGWVFLLILVSLGSAAPNITIQSPTNASYATSTINLNWTSNETLNWIAYNLDGLGNKSMLFPDDDTEDAYSDFTSCPNSTDENWSSFCRAVDGTQGYAYENHTFDNDTYSTISATWTSKNYVVGTSNGYLLCWDYLNSQWLWQGSAGGYSGTVNFTISPYCLISTLQVKTYYFNYNATKGKYVDYYEGKIARADYQLTSLADGSHNITIYGNNTAGQVGQSTYIYFTLDSTPPTTTAAAVEDDGSAYTFNTWTSSSYINVTLSCNDGSGIGCDTILYCTDTVNTCTPSTTYTTTVQISTENTSYIRYKSNDTLNNQETTKNQTIRIDTTNPTVAYNANTTPEGNLSQNWVYINIAVSDVNIDTVLFEWDGVNESFDNSGGGDYWENKTGLADGTYTIKAYVNDTVGHTNQTTTRTVTIDTTPPIVIINTPLSNGNYTSTNVTLNVTATDGITSISDCWYSLDSWSTNTTFTPNIETSFIGDQESNTLRIGCNDTLNNLNSTEIATFYVYIPPSFISPTPDIGWNSTGNNSFDVRVSTNASVNLFRFEWNLLGIPTNTTMNLINATEATYNKTETTTGNYSYRVWSNHSLTGYWGVSEVRWLTISEPPPDTTPPERYNLQPVSGTIYASSTTSVQLSVNTNEDANCSYATTDVAYNTSNLMSITDGTLHQQTITVSQGLSYTYYFRCQDSAGNNNTDSVNTTFSVAATTGGGGGGTTTPIEYTVNYRLWDVPITPSMWTNVLPNSTFNVIVTAENQELYPIILYAEITCRENDSLNSTCDLKSCKLYTKIIGELDYISYPSTGVGIYPQKTGNMRIECTVPPTAKLGDLYKATLQAKGCKANATAVCETKNYQIQYTIRSWFDAITGENGEQREDRMNEYMPWIFMGLISFTFMAGYVILQVVDQK